MDIKDNISDNSKAQSGHHQHPLANEISQEQKDLNEKALVSAEKDMQDDVELTATSPNDDLDEGESARLGGEIDET